MEEAGIDPSPIRGNAHMYRCPVCDATGKTGTTLGFGGTSCSLCQGRCYLQREPTPCPCCDAKGGFSSLFGLKWTLCRLCHGVRYLMDRPFPCPKCRASGLVKGLTGFFASPCDLCDRQRYLKHLHGRCVKCNFTSSLAKFFRKCINCSGIGYSPEPQHLCPRCNSTGHFRGNNCMLCGGNGVIHHEVVSCVKCNGAGEIKRHLSLLMGSSPCPTCNGQGYFQVFSSGSAIPVPQKSARKRVRDRGDDDHGPEPDLEAGGGPGGDADGLWRRGRSGQSGGSDPRRRVRTRTTPVKDALNLNITDSGRQQPFSSVDLRPQQQQRSTTGSLDTARGNINTILPNGLGPGMGMTTAANKHGAGGGPSASGGGFSPGVAAPEVGNGKRRRAH